MAAPRQGIHNNNHSSVDPFAQELPVAWPTYVLTNLPLSRTVPDVFADATTVIYVNTPIQDSTVGGGYGRWRGSGPLVL